jgi:hypothetical protein
MSKLLQIHPVLPTSNLQRDIAWYQQHTGFTCISSDSKYAVLQKENLYIHLQWHANTNEDPLIGGSVIKIFVDTIQPFFEEFVARKTITKEKLQLKTPWNTNEFGFYDLNNNAIFFVESL